MLKTSHQTANELLLKQIMVMYKQDSKHSNDFEKQTSPLLQLFQSHREQNSHQMLQEGTWEQWNHLAGWQVLQLLH